MSKQIFEDGSYIEVQKTPTDATKIDIIVSAKDQTNPLKRVVNIVEMSIDQFRELVKEVL